MGSARSFPPLLFIPACFLLVVFSQSECRRRPRSPVNSYVMPVAGATPGYESEVVFADGTFVEGSTAELSADGPLREPYAAFCQVRRALL